MQTLRSSRLVLAGILLLAASAVAQAQTSASGQTVVLRGARVIDGAGGSPLDSAAIVIRDGRIVALFKRLGVQAMRPLSQAREVV